MSAVEATGQRRDRNELGRFAEYVGLCGVAFMQPALDALGRNANFLVAAGTTWVDAVVVILLAALVPPVVGYSLERISGLAGPKARRVARLVLLSAVAGLALLRMVRTATSAEPYLVVGATAVATAALAFLLVRFEAITRVLRVLSFGTVLYAVVFLALSPATDVLFRDGNTGNALTKFGATPPVVFVVFDEFPTASLLDGTGAVDAELFPNFARLAQRTTWYRNTSAVAGFTQGAIPGLLTGRYPKTVSTPPTADEYPDNVLSMLDGRYHLNAHESVTRMCPSQNCTSLDAGGRSGLVRTTAQLWRDGLRLRRTNKPQRFDDANAWKSVLPNAREFIDSIASRSEPQLDYIHIQLPHYPWRIDGDLRAHRYVPGDPPGEDYLGIWREPGLSVARQRHLLQVQATDTFLGDLIDRLESTGVWDNALIVVTADHGISLTAGEPPRNLTATNATDIMWTPLFVKYPDQRSGVVDDRPAMAIDVVPTVLDVLGADGELAFDGRSLRGEPRRSQTRRIYPWTWFNTPRDLEANDDGWVEVDGEKAFAELLKRRAAPAGSDAGLRIYRAHPWGEFIGQRATAAGPDPNGGSFVIDNADSYRAVRLDGPANDWSWSIATFDDVAPGTPIAMTTNGTIAATCITVQGGGSSQCSFVVPPDFLHDGDNEVALYRIDTDRGQLVTLSMR